MARERFASRDLPLGTFLLILQTQPQVLSKPSVPAKAKVWCFPDSKCSLSHLCSRCCFFPPVGNLQSWCLKHSECIHGIWSSFLSLQAVGKPLGASLSSCLWVRGTRKCLGAVLPCASVAHGCTVPLIVSSHISFSLAGL